MSDSVSTLVGNLTRDPEIRFTTGGKATASAGLAVNKRYQVNGEWESKTSFFNLVFWDTLAENVANSLSKGTRVIVHGNLEQREYEVKDTNEKRNITELIVQAIGPDLRWATAEVTKVENGGGTATKATTKATKPTQRQLDEEEPF